MVGFHRWRDTAVSAAVSDPLLTSIGGDAALRAFCSVKELGVN